MSVGKMSARDISTEDIEDIRPEILAFAIRMEERMSHKDSKYGPDRWKKLSYLKRVKMVQNEVDELNCEISTTVIDQFGEGITFSENLESEMMDVAITTMFLDTYVREYKSQNAEYEDDEENEDDEETEDD